MSETGKLDWMYRSGNDVVDDEEYLLGRKVDRYKEKPSNTTESVPGSVLFGEGCGERSEADALRKMREDPLEAVRQREMQLRKQLLSNPVRLRRTVEAGRNKTYPSQHKDGRDVRRKKRNERGNESEEDSHLDALLSDKLTKLIRKHGKEKILSGGKTKQSSDTDSSSSDSDTSESHSDSSGEEPRSRREQRRNRHRSRSGSDSSRQDRHSSPDHGGRSGDKTGRRKYGRNRSGSDSPRPTKPFGLYVPEGAKKVTEKEVEKWNETSNRKRREEKRQQEGQGPGGKRRRVPAGRVDEEERRRRLDEMRNNVSWRNEVMSTNVSRHHRQLNKELSQHNYSPDFIRNQLSKGMCADSVEKRIKSNLQNIQRSSSSMDSSFSKR